MMWQLATSCCLQSHLSDFLGVVLPRILLKARYKRSSLKRQVMCSYASVSRPITHLTHGQADMEGVERDVDMKGKIQLPDIFLEFLKQNEIDPAIYDKARDLPRYIRLKATSAGEISELEEELGVRLTPLAWLPGFYIVPPQIQIAGTKAYQEGKIYGMDAASGAAVVALGISPGDHILDLCAAPGAKLCMMAEMLDNSGTLTATDISQPRLAVSRTMLLKYDLGSHCRLFLADGTVFSILPVRKIAESGFYSSKQLTEKVTKRDAEKDTVPGEVDENPGKHTENVYVDSHIYREWKLKKTAKEKKASKRLKYLTDALERVGGRESELLFYGKYSGIVGMKVTDVFDNISLGDAFYEGYDKVLVDAECTHDGSLKHIYKFEQWGWDTFERRFFNPERMTSITSLQLRLLNNGFRLLKIEGTLVYSTCSLTLAQNEEVVEKFLAMQPKSVLVEISSAKYWPCKHGGIPHTVRFDPIVSNTSGLFIAKISRLP